MQIYNLKKPVRIETDASDYTTAGVIMQDQQPVEFISHKMNKAEQNYTITEKEMLAVIQAVKEWRRYLEGGTTENQVVTDYKNLIYFQNARITN